MMKATASLVILSCLLIGFFADDTLAKLLKKDKNLNRDAKRLVQLLEYQENHVKKQNGICDGFDCGNGQCIFNSWKCDGDNDCSNNEDEKDCPCNGFQCDDGQCITSSYVCDGDDDCSNAEDEQDCPCDGFLCDDDVCITSSYECDGLDDCANAEDEQNCPSTSVGGGGCDGFTCNSGSCIPENWVCDGWPDCNFFGPGDSEDEDGCPAESAGCDGFLCEPGMCIASHYRCDGFGDCWNDEDEENCGGSGTTTDCNGYPCNDGSCIPEDWKCDGWEDCSQDDDEDGCPSEGGETSWGPSWGPSWEPSWGQSWEPSWGLSWEPSWGQSWEPSWGSSWDITCDEATSYTCQDSGLGTYGYGYFDSFCIPNEWKCDGTPDCPRFDDELDCKPCDDFNPCVYGECKTIDDDPKFECECRDTEDGKKVVGYNCDIILIDSACLEDECVFHNKMQIRHEVRREPPPTIAEKKKMALKMHNRQLDETSPTYEHDCSDMEFPCDGGNTCVHFENICDGFAECQDGIDELMCDLLFCDHHCDGDTKCLPYWEICDGVAHCDDNSDEFQCGFMDVHINVKVDDTAISNVVLEIFPNSAGGPPEADGHYRYEATIPDNYHSKYVMDFGLGHFETVFGVDVHRSTTNNLILDKVCYHLTLKEVVNAPNFDLPEIIHGLTGPASGKRGKADNKRGKAQSKRGKARNKRDILGRLKAKLADRKQGEGEEPQPKPPMPCLMICSDGVASPCEP